MAKTTIEKRLRTAGCLVLLGLLVEMASLLRSHPTAFILFLVPGGLLLVLGMRLYLYSVVSGESNVPEPKGE
ncbi:MAG: hypothetical protein AABN33_07970 [Acidobacteriota bacterium]